jgi:DNA-directed RNA polymerase subunit M/transcription elongation factor TFIIS
MATPGLRISCPNCQQQMTVPDAVRGKKVRCKKCGGAVPVPAGGVDTRVRTEQAQAKATAAAAQDEEGLAKDPYGVTETSLAPRCPHCAYELDPPDSRICLHCGYDMINRQRRPSIKTYDRTGGDWFWWLLPGVLCLITFFLIIGFALYYHFKLPYDVLITKDADSLLDDRLKAFGSEKDIAFTAYMFHPGIEVWLVVLGLAMMWKSGKFAFKRLVLNYLPPEKIKEK